MKNEREDPEFIRIAAEIAKHEKAVNALLKELTEKFPPQTGWHWTISATAAPIKVYLEESP